MTGLFILAIALALGGGLLTRISPTVDEIKDRFDLAQTYYAAQDYDNGVTIFSEIAETPNRALLNVDTISVVINDLVLPVRVAARYQVGNSLRNMGLDLLARSESALAERDSLLAEQRRAEAVESLRLARRHFADIVDDERALEHVRVMSQYQIIRAAFAMEDYVSVVEDVARLLEHFPGNDYEEEQNHAVEGVDDDPPEKSRRCQVRRFRVYGLQNAKYGEEKPPHEEKCEQIK